MRSATTLIIFSLAVAASLGEKTRYDNYKVYSVTPKSWKGVETLLQLEQADDFNFWSSLGPVGTPVQIMVSPKSEGQLLRIVESSGMDAKVMMSNVQDNIDEESTSQARARLGFGWTRYNTLEEINVWLRTQSLLYAQNVTLIEGGRSYEGRTIYGLKISYNERNANRSVFVESTIHAREWITAAVVTYIINEILTSQNETIREFAESYDWYFFPVFNPDGYEYSHTTDRLWRKTRVPHSVLCIGADPNRNWDYHWNHGGTSGSPCTEIFRGTEPFSEPSCRSMSEYITTISSKLLGYISFHSFSQLLLIPYGYTDAHLDNYDLIYEIGQKSAAALAQRYGTQYRVGTVYETIYPASGSSADWVKGAFNTSVVYTYELRDTGAYGFLLPPDQIIPTALETLDSFITIFKEYDIATNGTNT